VKKKLSYDEQIHLIGILQSHMKEAYNIEIGKIAANDIVELIYSKIDKMIIKPLRESDETLQDIKKLLK
jgi:uncharacterized protein (DUF2164 family)